MGDELERANKATQDLLAEIEDLNAQIITLKAAQSMLQKKLKQNEQQTQNENVVNTEMDELKNDKLSLQLKIDQSLEENQKLILEINALKNDNLNIVQVCHDYKAQIQQKQNDINASKKEVADLKDKIVALKVENDNLMKEKENIKNKLSKNEAFQQKIMEKIGKKEEVKENKNPKKEISIREMSPLFAVN